jgi:hypothetical protein
MCDPGVGTNERGVAPRPGWGALYGLILVMVTVLAAVEASGASEGVRMPLDCGVVLAGFAVTRLWVGRNRAALDLQNWCVCASGRVTVREIASRRATRPRLASGEPRIVVAEQIDEPEEFSSVGSGASTRLADLRRD